jgi:Zn2+/Cd2+-exporting ATPase
MGCDCCHDTSSACVDSVAHAGASGGARGAEGARARFAVRLLAIRFSVAFALFAASIALSVLRPGSFVILTRALFVVSWFVAGYRVAWNAVRNALRGELFDENFLMTVATVGAFAIGQWSEGAAVMLFYNLGEMVQESAVNRSRKSITDLMDVRPDVARLSEGDALVHPSSVPVGSKIRVLPGEKVPLDGKIVSGSTSFDTSRLTGESAPRDAIPGDVALAGFVNGAGLVEIRTTEAFGDTAASKMLALIEDAQNRKAKAERLITSFARVYTPIVTLGAVLLAIVPPVFGALIGGAGFSSLASWSAFAPWVSRALVFLVISCPCAFVISVPLGFFGGIGGAAKKGILVKGADYIDVLAKAKGVVFDKTGTLTRGEFAVRSVEPAGVSSTGAPPRSAAAGSTSDVLAHELVHAAAIAESRSGHPVARAILEYAKGLGIDAQATKVSDVLERAGYGVSLAHEGRTLLAGSRRLMEERGVSDLPSETESGAIAGTAVDVAIDGTWKGRIVLGDTPKDDASLAVERLRELGVRDIVMLTGDVEAAARDAARAIGITDYRSGVLPHQKVDFFDEISAKVKRERPKATVLFVGDGINDAPVLARADAGLAMGGIGSDAAIEAADVVLMNDSPLLVAEAIRSARWTRHIVMENIVLSFAIKIGFLALGAIGVATLWEAVFADVGVALLATVNSLRARR